MSRLYYSSTGSLLTLGLLLYYLTDLQYINTLRFEPLYPIGEFI
jgi:hypothetical protein